MMNKTLLVSGAVLGLLAIVAAPALIAVLRRHPEKSLIYRLSPLSAFSFALWIALMVWASSDVRQDAVISRYVHRLREKNYLPTVIAALVLVGIVATFFSIRK